MHYKTINMDTTNFSTGSATVLPNGSDENAKGYAKTVATAVTGAALGSGFPFIIGKIKDTINEVESAEVTPVKEETPAVEWSDGNIAVATGVTDDMSFNQAFAAARTEVGAGGAFEWRGNVYGTYYAEEWNNMSVAEKAEFNNHFAWNNLDTTDNASSHSTIDSTTEIEVVSVAEPHSSAQANNIHNEVDVMAVEPEIEVLGVVHDMSTGANLGGMTVDGQDVFLIDVDGDMEFDFMASDLNNNNVVDDGEVADIHGQGFSVNDLGGISHIAESLNGEDNLPDYMADNTYEI